MKNIQITLKELENKIDAEKLAIADAKHNIPPSDSVGPDASESKIRLIIIFFEYIIKNSLNLFKIFF